MAKIIRVYSGADGRSHIAEEPMVMQPFTDTEGAHGEGTPTQRASGVAFRQLPVGYVLSWHCAPRRQYSITISGTAEIEVGDGTKVRPGPSPLLRESPQSNVKTVRATSPAFIARNASLMSSRRPRRLTISSSSSRPWR